MWPHEWARWRWLAVGCWHVGMTGVNDIHPKWHRQSGTERGDMSLGHNCTSHSSSPAVHPREHGFITSAAFVSYLIYLYWIVWVMKQQCFVNTNPVIPCSQNQKCLALQDLPLPSFCKVSSVHQAHLINSWKLISLSYIVVVVLFTILFSPRKKAENRQNKWGLVIFAVPLCAQCVYVLRYCLYINVFLFY